MSSCPFFGRCGGCKIDFASSDYRDKKMSGLVGLSMTDVPVWIGAGLRRRADSATRTIFHDSSKSTSVYPQRNTEAITVSFFKSDYYGETICLKI